MPFVEIDLEKDPFVERRFPEQNIKVKSFFLDLFGNFVEKPLQTPTRKMQELALVTVVKPNCIPKPHKHKDRGGPTNIDSSYRLPRIATNFFGKDITFEPPHKRFGKYIGTEEIHYLRCNADLWVLYGGSPNRYERINLMKRGPLQISHHTDNATAIVKLSDKPVRYVARFFPALDPKEMFYPSDLDKVLANYYQNI